MNKNNRFVFTLIAFIVSAFAHQASASPAAVIQGECDHARPRLLTR